MSVHHVANIDCSANILYKITDRLMTLEGGPNTVPLQESKCRGDLCMRQDHLDQWHRVDDPEASFFRKCCGLSMDFKFDACDAVDV